MLLDGKTTSNLIKEELKEKIRQIKEKYNQEPHLAIIQVGNISASNIYIRNKIRDCNEIGIIPHHIHFSEETKKEELEKKITELNNDQSINGIIVQLPLPKHLDERAIIEKIDPIKDVDGFAITNKGALFCNLDTMYPATPKGIMTLLERYNIEIEGKRAVVVGRSNIVGKPIAMMLLNKNATVTICHSRTRDLKEICKTADILISCVGKTKMITSDMVKKDAVIVDVGMNRDENGKLCGDVDFDNVKNIASYISPVPGGVGPMTIASLLEATYQAFIKQRGINQC